MERSQGVVIMGIDYETQIALMEGAMNSAADDYFAARPQLDNTHNLRIFEAGFRRAWEMKELQSEVKK